MPDHWEQTTWQAEPAVAVRAAGLTLTVVPGRSGKIASLLDQWGDEWLVQPTLPVVAPARPGDRFVDSDMCGWDECAPTINACRLPDGVPHAGAHLPDHGDLWTADWDVDAATSRAQGQSLPYELERRIFAVDAGARISYRVTAAGVEALPFLWAAHPQFRSPDGTSVVLPDHVEEVVDVLAPQPQTVAWTAELATTDSLPEGEHRKVYVLPDQRIDEVGLRRADGRTLRMRWSSGMLPYFGIWSDRRRYVRSREPVVALEPTTGYYDATDSALAAGSLLMVEPGTPVEWSVDLTIS